MSKHFIGLLMIMALLLATTAAYAVEVKPEGRIFFDYMYNVSGYPDWDSRYGDNDFNEFELTRAYMSFKVQFNDQWSGRIVGDVTRFKTINVVYNEDGNLADVETENGPYTYYLKYAYGNYQPSEYFAVRFGMLQTPFIDCYNNAFGYRYVIKDPMGLWHMDSSSDMGVAAYGNFPGNFGSYYAMFRNGEGYKHEEVNKGKGFQLRIALTPLQMNAATQGLALSGAYLMNNDNPSDPDLDTTLVNTLITYKYMFNENWGLGLGGGYDMSTAATDVEDADDITSTIIHGYGVVYLPMNFGFFARYDMYDPDTENDEDTHGYQDERSMLLVGVSYDPVKNIAFALNYRTIMYTAEVLDDQGEEVTLPSDAYMGMHCKVKF